MNAYKIEQSERTEADGSTTYVLTIFRKEGKKSIEMDYVSASPITLEDTYIMTCTQEAVFERTSTSTEEVGDNSGAVEESTESM